MTYIRMAPYILPVLADRPLVMKRYPNGVNAKPFYQHRAPEKAPAFAKTSGSGGLHIYVPMPPETRYDAGLLFCQIVSTIVARKHATRATVERSLKARGRRIYLDYLQNARGKTLASAYSARASEFAGVSMPLTWDELDEGISPRDFTIRTAAARLEAAGDLWAPLRRSRGADLCALMTYAEP